MAIAIRIPTETHAPLPQYYTRHRAPLLSARLYRRILPLTLLFILVVESYRFFSTTVPAPPPPPLTTTDLTPLIITTTPADDAFDLPPPTPFKNLIVVACHAIYLPSSNPPTGKPGESEQEWFLQPMQRGKKAQDTFLAHILAGVEAAKQDPSALLVFSGGETRAEVGARTEGGSYYELAAQRGLLDDIANRTTTEVFALDSYQNLLFSLLRFHELTDSYPQKITLVSYAFKRERFVELHRHAIRFPRTRFEFVGIDPTWDKEEENVRNGELENAVKLWREDLYACNVEGGLRSKRRGRNAGRRKWTYGLSVETSVKELLRWCEKGGGEVFAGRLPWSE